MEAKKDEQRPFFKPWTFRPASEIPPRRWLYDAHYIRRYVSTTSAPGGVGKSALAIIEAMAMASGKPLLGITPPDRLRVAYWNGEDPLEETERRIAAAMTHYGLTKDDLAGWLFWGSGRDDHLIIAHQTRNGAEVLRPNVDRVTVQIRQHVLDLVILDPFVSTHRVTENDNPAIDMVVKEWAAVGDRTDCGIELIHHTRKANGSEMSVEDSRGASAFLNAARSARVLNVMTKEEAERSGVEQRLSYFRVDNGKANLAPPSEVSAWFRFVSVKLENDPLGPGDSVGVVTPWQWPNSLDGVKAADLLKVQQKIAESEWREDQRSPSWAGYAIADALGINMDAQSSKARIKRMLSTWLTTGALKRVRRDGPDRKPKQFVEVGNWVEL